MEKLSDLKNDLENDMDCIARILRAASENFEYFNYLHSPLSNGEFHFVEANSFLKHLRFLAWQMTVIELSKLVSPSDNTQKFNLFKLLRKFKNTNYRSFNIPDAYIPIWEGSILKHGNNIVLLYEIRNRIYAHTDQDTSELEQSTFRILAIRELLHDLQTTLNFIADTTLNKKYSMPELYYLRKDFDLLQRLIDSAMNSSSSAAPDF